MCHYGNNLETQSHLAQSSGGRPQTMNTGIAATRRKDNKLSNLLDSSGHSYTQVPE